MGEAAGDPRRRDSGEAPSRVFCCLVIAAALQVAALGLSPGGVFAAAPTGPRLAIVTHDSCCGRAVITVGPDGERSGSLVAGPPSRNIRVASDLPSWSADGRWVAFGASRPGVEGPVVAIAREDGSGLRLFSRAVLQGGNPIISPDGASVAFMRADLVRSPRRHSYLVKTSIWLLAVKSGSIRQLTRWRFGTISQPTSYSPDGSTLAAQSFGPGGFRALAIDVGSGHLALLARDATEPTYSPDGTKLAFVRLRNWRAAIREDATAPSVVELVVARADGTAPERLLRKRGLLAWPSWDPSGSRLTFTRSAIESVRSYSPLKGDEVMAINADGTCLTQVLSDPETTLFGSAWQPGVGREAGPISC
jgi:Tol biopolymer transport system component